MLNQKAVLPFFRFGTPTESLDAPCRNEKLAGAKVFNTPVIALVVAFGYYLGSQIGFLLTPASTPIATFWPPNAMLLGALLLTPARSWWVLVLAVFPTHLFVQQRCVGNTANTRTHQLRAGVSKSAPSSIALGGNAARRALANSCAKLVGPCVGGVPYASFRSAKDRHTRDL